MNIYSTETVPESNGAQEVSGYEAPAIESVLTPESLEREVLYAGTPPTSTIPTTPPL